MIKWSPVARHPLVLAASACLGALMAAVVPKVVPLMEVLAELFVALLQMAGLPLMMVAVPFGLRRLMDSPQPLRRTALMVVTAAALIALAALVGATVSRVALDTIPVDEAARTELGERTNLAESLLAVPMESAGHDPSASGGHSLLPVNVFKVMAAGQVPAMLVAALFFGVALTRQSAESSRTFNQALEMVYRSLEGLIGRINLLLPLAAWALAGSASAPLTIGLLAASGQLLLPMVVSTGLWTVSALVLIAWRAERSLVDTLEALSTPLCISLLVPSPVASIPAYIHAMSERLGYSRGLVELLMPVAPFFLKAGEALYFAAVFMFLCSVYQRPVHASEMALIVWVSCVAAWVSVQLPVGKTLLAGSLGFGVLELPVEALAPVLLSLELLTGGLRQLSSGLAACTLAAWFSPGRPLAAAAAGARTASALEGQPVRLGSTDAVLVLALAAAALGLAFLLGLGLALRP